METDDNITPDAEGSSKYEGWKWGINFMMAINKDMDNPTYNIPETIGHEVFLHQYYIDDYIKAWKKSSFPGSDELNYKERERNYKGYKDHLSMTDDKNGVAKKYYEFISQLKGVLNPKEVQKQVEHDRNKNYTNGKAIQAMAKKKGYQ